MNIYKLMNKDNEEELYQGFNIKPTVGALIKVKDVDPEKLEEIKKKRNTYNNISFNKVYEVYRVLNVKQVIIKDDTGENVHLYSNQYQVVEKITETELSLLKQNQEIVQSIGRLIKSKTK